MFELYNKLFNPEDKGDLSSELRRESAAIVNYTFKHDASYRQVRIFNPIYKTFSKPIDMKLSRSSDFTVTGDAPTYRAMFRPGITTADVNDPDDMYDEYGNLMYNIDNGAIIYIENIETKGLKVHSDNETDEERAVIDGSFWMIVGNTEEGQITQHYIVLCDYLLKWIYDGNIYTQPISIRSSKSYSDGIYATSGGNTVNDFIDNQIGFVCPLNHNTRYLDMNDRFFISFNDEHPSIFRITKMESGLKKGIIFCTLVQDEYNSATDDKKNKICNIDKLPDITYSLDILNGYSIGMIKGDEVIINLQLNKTVDGVTSTIGSDNVVLESLNPDIVSIEGNLLTALAYGEATVRATYEDITKVINVKVSEEIIEANYECIINSSVDYVMYNGIIELEVKLFKDGIEVRNFEYEYSFNNEKLVQYSDKDDGNTIIIQANNSKIKGTLTVTVVVKYDNKEIIANKDITIGGVK